MAERKPSNKRMRWLLVGIGGVCLGIAVGAGVGIAVGWQVAMQQSLMSRQCETLDEVDLTVDELVALKRRWKAYIRSEEPDASLVLTTREATFLLRAESDLGLDLTGKAERLEARVTVPADGGCYNVRFTGGVVVDDGLAVLDVDELVIGGTDLSDLAGLGGALGGSRQAISPDDLVDPHLSEMLANVEHLEVEGGDLHIRFVDPKKVWR